MTALVLVGNGKFALEITRYVQESIPDAEIVGYLSITGATPAPSLVEGAARLDDYGFDKSVRLVLAVSDPEVRRTVLDSVGDRLRDLAIDVVHPSSRMDSDVLDGVGNIIGPDCYFGVNARIGSFNVVNYKCSVGHHSRLGTNNFVSPNFNSGNSIVVGDNNFFGLSCTVGPDVDVGSNCRFQAGVDIFESVKSEHSYFSTSRLKSFPTRR